MPLWSRCKFYKSMSVMVVTMIDLIINGGTLMLFDFFLRKIWIKESVSFI